MYQYTQPKSVIITTAIYDLIMRINDDNNVIYYIITVVVIIYICDDCYAYYIV